MQIYEVRIRKQDAEPLGAILSSYRTPINTVKIERFINKEKAEALKIKYDEAIQTLGLQGIWTDIITMDVNE